MTPQQDLPSSVMHEKYFEMMISDRLDCEYVHTAVFVQESVYTQPRPSNIYNSSFIDWILLQMYTYLFTYVYLCSMLHMQTYLEFLIFSG